MTRGERRDRTERHVAHRIREWETVTRRPFDETAIRGAQRKGHHVFGCGKTRCGLCHHEKFPKRRPTRQETRALQEAAAEIEHPECWPEQVERDLVLAFCDEEAFIWFHEPSTPFGMRAAGGKHF